MDFSDFQTRTREGRNGRTSVLGEFQQDVVLPCSFKSGSFLVIHWRVGAEEKVVHSYYRDQDQLSRQDSQYRNRTALFHSEIHQGNASLRLHRLRPEDAGIYFCYAASIDGKVEEEVELIFAAFFTPAMEYTKQENSSLLTCRASVIYPHVEWTWSGASETKNLKEGKSGDLYFIESQQTVADSSSLTWCSIQNSLLRRTWKGTWTRAEPLVGNEGEEVSFPSLCAKEKLSPDLPFIVTWSKVTQASLVVLASFDNTSRKLNIREPRLSWDPKAVIQGVSNVTLKNLLQSDEGEYLCSISSRSFTQLTVRQLTVQKPTVQKAATQKLTGQNPFILKPAVQKPTVQKPTVQKPTVQKPTVQKPATQKPTVQKPATQKLTGQNPFILKPAVQKPTVQNPTVEKPATQKLTGQNPFILKPAVQKPTVQKPTVQKPTVQKPTVQKSATQKPTVQKPATQKPTVPKPTVPKPTVPKPTVPKPTVPKPTMQKLTVQKPTVQKPIVQALTVENAITQTFTGQQVSGELKGELDAWSVVLLALAFMLLMILPATGIVRRRRGCQSKSLRRESLAQAAESSEEVSLNPPFNQQFNQGLSLLVLTQKAWCQQLEVVYHQWRLGLGGTKPD
ncbi:HERV-H LTR-associating protein 2 [Ornithorhynchus anatinus]|uniref:HERV-H LTR-associating protein 2 n=1 Tax=Ornithorhynchus anatinus TaxID=9258 RepID=UPI0019D4B92D|nr:HERV-H LTR-associating protein 2 [Ornithorhynchus anatinus]